MEIERARLLSLALELGFEEEAATQCLDRLIDLYGEDGKEFVTVEHCGDDYLVALADAMQDHEDWDDLQAIESEACGALNNILEKEVPKGFETDCRTSLGSYKIGKDDSFTGHQYQEKLSSNSDEDSDVEILSQNNISNDQSVNLNGNKSYAHFRSVDEPPSISKQQLSMVQIRTKINGKTINSTSEHRSSADAYRLILSIDPSGGDGGGNSTSWNESFRVKLIGGGFGEVGHSSWCTWWKGLTPPTITFQSVPGSLLSALIRAFFAVELRRIKNAAICRRLKQPFFLIGDFWETMASNEDDDDDGEDVEEESYKVVEEIMNDIHIGENGDDEEEGIDVKAEEFIAKFYQQMKLQRQVSLLQYNEMLYRSMS
ncbi:hypothetical protein J5N97_008865 [Dioscorea zingiberensis]|uniref:Uncharacterized protein n=1 Tax=Dioscorea zingiberensis TaxID=325984 RepID=A0A9D5HKW1_9LILI|nr:hypothetical protein J5N97_008865 [Dioscorea zingiberensis]